MEGVPIGHEKQVGVAVQIDHGKQVGVAVLIVLLHVRLLFLLLLFLLLFLLLLSLSSPHLNKFPHTLSLSHTVYIPDCRTVPQYRNTLHP